MHYPFPTYAGPALECGGTDPRCPNASPALRRLIAEGRITGTVLDYGAGKAGRNAAHLRSLGHRVYAYDPFHGDEGCGWTGVSRHRPAGRFDTGFTSFVLNVVPAAVEAEIIHELAQTAARVLHITRNQDIVEMVHAGLQRRDSVVSRFYLAHVACPVLAGLHARGGLDRWHAEAFARFGTATSRGFQRLPMLEQRGFDLLHQRTGWKVYTISFNPQPSGEPPG